MGIPAPDKMIQPVLRYMANGEQHRRKNIIDMLTNYFSLTENERSVLSYTALMESYLSSVGFIERTSIGYYQITSRGLEVLNQDSEENFETEVDNRTPEESIEENYQKIREGLAAELLQQIKNNTYVFFEELVIDLLVAMGYGGSREDAQTVGRSRDGGIDGIINEDRLGLDAIYVQAKRWNEGNVGEPDVARFAGALARKGANKGVFITTSDFTGDARAYDAAGFKIILIDGKQLAQLMIDHDVGVSVEKTYEIKRVDSDYFAENTE